MTRYLLDTSVLTELEDRRKPGFVLAAARLAALDDTDEVLLSVLSAYKQLKMSTVDFIVASSALEHDAVLVSDDRIFQTIQRFHPALRVENWLADETSASDLEG